MSDAVWGCKIGEIPRELLPDGADAPLRQAVADAYLKLTGQECDFIFSGWGEELTLAERNVANRTLSTATATKRKD